MRRTVSTDRQVDKFGVGKDGFRLGNQAGGVFATVVSEEDMDGPQEEIVTTIEAAGLSPVSIEGNAAQLADAIGRLAGRLNRGLRTGLFVRTSNDVITLSPVSGDRVSVEIDGLTRDAASLVWDLTTDLDTGAAASNTIYYLYGLVTGGALDTKISTTAPSTTGKVGYHPTRTSERCLFAMRTKAGSAVWAAFDETPDQFTLLRPPDAIEFNVGTSRPANYTALTLTGVPATARSVRINAHARHDDVQFHYTHEALATAGAAVATNKSAYRIGALAETSDTLTDSNTFDIPVDSTPAIAWGVIEFLGSTPAVLVHEVRVAGWRNAL